MNLLSPITTFNGGATSGTIKVQVSHNKPYSTYTTVYTASVKSPDSIYYLNLVPILSAEFSPEFSSSNQIHNTFAYKVLFNNTQKASGIFYYSDSDSYAPEYITTTFNESYAVPFTKFDSTSIDVDGTSFTVSATTPTFEQFAPETSFRIGTTSFTKTCHEYQIDYINRHGVWSHFIPEGNTFRTDSVSTQESLSFVNHLSSVYKYHKTYKKEIVPTFNMNTGWLSESQATIFAHSLLESPYLILHTPTHPSGFPVRVVDSSVTYLNPLKDSIMNYQFSLESLVPLVKY